MSILVFPREFIVNNINHFFTIAICHLLVSLSVVSLSREGWFEERMVRKDCRRKLNLRSLGEKLRLIREREEVDKREKLREKRKK